MTMATGGALDSTGGSERLLAWRWSRRRRSGSGGACVVAVGVRVRAHLGVKVSPPCLPPVVTKAWPPNWLRSADTSRRPKASFFWEANRANRAEEMTGADTPRSMASSTVQRPSPESIDHPLDLVEARLGAQGPLGQLEEPAAHHRAVAPDGGDLVEVEVELGGLGHDLEPLGVGLHEAVLDAVVDHLDEVAGPGRSDVGVAALGGEGEEGGLGRRPPPPWCPRPSGSSPPSGPRCRPRCPASTRAMPSAASWATSGAVSL